MQRLKAIQQRVFCIFFRPYQRITGTDSRGKPTDKLLEVEFDTLAWYDPTQCAPCPPTSGTTCPTCPTMPKDFRPIGPTPGGILPEITNPAGTRLLKYQKDALQYYDIVTGQKKSYIYSDSKTMQPFNEDMMFTEDLWFLHSTWTSFEKTKLIIRPLVDAFGFDSIMVCAYVPIGMDILPNK